MIKLKPPSDQEAVQWAISFRSWLRYYPPYIRAAEADRQFVDLAIAGYLRDRRHGKPEAFEENAAVLRREGDEG